MDEDRQLGDWSGRAMAINGEAFTAGHHEAAYHALMAALHLAETLRDPARLLDIARVAGEQQQAIDALTPVHRLSSQRARSRGHEAVFALAVQQAKVWARMCQNRHPPG